MMTNGRRIFGSLARLCVPRSGTNARRAIVGAVMVLALTACGVSPTILIALDSASAELLRGAEIHVEVTLTRTGGASADVTLTIAGLPANVDADFSPPTLSGGTLSSTLTISAAGAAVEGSYDVIVTGAGTGLTDTAALTLDVVSLTVRGQVVALYDLPVIGAGVASQNDTEITDANGEFELTGLSVPYDLTVWSAADEWVQVYEGLTADELFLAPITAALPTLPSRSAGISGTLSGGVIPVPANQIVLVCVEGVDGFVLGCDSVAPTETSYSFNAQWVGPANRAARVHALQLERDINGYPLSYQGYASQSVSLVDTAAAVANLDLGDALETTPVIVDIDSPVAILATIGAVQLAPNMAMPVMLVSSADTEHLVLMPVLPDATYSFVAAVSTTQFGWTSGHTGGTANVAVADAPQLISPADLTTGVTTATNFVATSPTGGPTTYMWDADVGNLLIAVTGTDTIQSIPDISSYGLALPAGADFSWRVIGHSGTGTEAGARGISDYYRFLMILSQSSLGFVGDGTFSLSPDGREFTTAP